MVPFKSGETKTVYSSGQVAIDREGKVVGKGDLGVQAAQVLRASLSSLSLPGPDLGMFCQAEHLYREYEARGWEDGRLGEEKVVHLREPPSLNDSRRSLAGRPRLPA